MKINSGSIEKIFIILVFSILLYIGYSNLANHQIDHDFPYGYLASDNFQHQIRAEAIKDIGNFKYDAPYIAKGFDNVIGIYPPVIYHLAVIFSHLSGLEVYDAIYFMVFLLASVAALIMYLIIRDFNKNIAIISLPLSILIFASGSMVGFIWGHWPSIVSQFFLVAFFWSLLRIDLKKSFIFITLFTAAMTLTHTSELLFGIVTLIIFLTINFLNKNLKKESIKTILIGGIISVILTFYFLVIFKHTWAVGEPYSFHVMQIWEGNPGLYIGDFGILLIFIVIGIVLSLLLIKKMHTALIVGLAMLIAGFSNYAGFSFRAFQIRFLWPVYLSVFFGFAVYKLSKLAIKKWNILHSITLSIIFIIILTGTITIPYVHQYEKLSTPGVMNQYHWEMLNWFPENTEENEKIYFFYGDTYSQDALLRNSKRVHYQVDPSDFIDALNNKEIRRGYVTELPGDGGVALAYKTSTFGFNDYQKEIPREYFFGKKDICKFDYYIFDRISRQPILAQYNLLIASELAKKDFIEPVFENEVSIILKNNKPGDDCIEQRKFE